MGKIRKIEERKADDRCDTWWGGLVGWSYLISEFWLQEIIITQSQCEETSPAWLMRTSLIQYPYREHLPRNYLLLVKVLWWWVWYQYHIAVLAWDLINLNFITTYSWPGQGWLWLHAVRTPWLNQLLLHFRVPDKFVVSGEVETC